MTFVDVTEHQEMLAALHASEERFQRLSDSGMIGIAAFTADGHITEANPAFMAMVGASDAMIQAGRLTWADLLPPPPELPEQRLAAFFALGTMAPHEREYCRVDGRCFWGILGGLRSAMPHAGVAFLLDTSDNVRRQQHRSQVEQQAAYAAFVRQLVSVQEEERHRIARELHDHFGQQLAALMLGLKSLEQAVDTPAPQQVLTQLQEIVTTIGREAHQLALDLRPTALDDLGLLPALQSYTAQWSQRTGIVVDVHAHGLADQRLASVLETTIYRVVQEALTNVLKHAAASQVSLIVHRYVDHVRLIVEDNGQGFDLVPPQVPNTPPRLGLLGMQERVALVAGTMQIESTPATGTTLFVRIPLVAAHEAAEETHAADSLSG